MIHKKIVPFPAFATDATGVEFVPLECGTFFGTGGE